MNELETRAEYIDPKLKASGWGEVEGLMNKTQKNKGRNTTENTAFFHYISTNKKRE
ncbi:MAG: hypothetical protein U9P63_03270 [Patescibacteria group bacterium]|nr:hypothetical protein [Patescibacteria group bacterium]